MKTWLLLFLLTACSKSSSTMPGFKRVAGDPANETTDKRKIAFEMQVPEASKPCTSVYLCFEPVDEKDFTWTQATIQPTAQFWKDDRPPITSLDDARRWVQEMWGSSYELRKQRDTDRIGDDLYVWFSYIGSEGNGVVKFSKGSAGYIAASCTGTRSQSADLLHKICSSFKAL